MSDEIKLKEPVAPDPIPVPPTGPLAPIVQWMISSLAFRKASSLISGFAAGLWVAANYWRQIHATLDAWGISRNEWMNALVAIMAAGGITASIAASLANQRQQKAAEESGTH